MKYRETTNRMVPQFQSCHLLDQLPYLLQLLHRQRPKVSPVGLEEKAIKEKVRGEQDAGLENPCP